MKDFLREIILEAGQISLEYRGRLGEIKISEKAARDIVSEADLAVEDFLIGRIRQEYPGHAVFGEESGEHGGKDYRWIIDPIDGTVSFVRGQAYYSVSVAVEKDGQLELGAVYAPVLDELFTAQKNSGAFLNGVSIHVSGEKELAGCLLATGFACRRDKSVGNLPYFSELLDRITDVRRCGSAALDMCYTACGKVDGFWELSLNIYDVAAGILIAKEAGGTISDFSGNPVSDYKEIVCTNGFVQDELVGVLSEVKAKITS